MTVQEMKGKYELAVREALDEALEKVVTKFMDDNGIEDPNGGTGSSTQTYYDKLVESLLEDWTFAYNVEHK